MHYLLLIANAPDAWDGPGASSQDGVFADWMLYTQALHEAGALVDGAGLQAPDTATTVRRREGRRLLTDGPFTETKEHLVGYYLIDVPHLDVALDWAARMPNIRTGSVEVRPVTPGSETRSTLAALGVARA